MTDASGYLRAIAQRIAPAYAELPQTRAILLTGSAAEGTSDCYSDLDLILYYAELPSPSEFEAARTHNGGTMARVFGPRDADTFGESYRIDGVECQFGHTTIRAWEQEIASVLEGLDVTSPIQKAIQGMAEGTALHGESLFRGWQARLSEYPEALARAMVEKHLQFFPVWYLQGRLTSRDATLWLNQVMVESAQNLLAVLAGLNREYYSTFQFKRASRFIGKLRVAPPNLATRLESLFAGDRAAAIGELESLVGETISLVEALMPEIDTSGVRARLGQREQPWILPAQAGILDFSGRTPA
jgi:hypothetical protein